MNPQALLDQFLGPQATQNIGERARNLTQGLSTPAMAGMAGVAAGGIFGLLLGNKKARKTVGNLAGGRRHARRPTALDSENGALHGANALADAAAVIAGLHDPALLGLAGDDTHVARPDHNGADPRTRRPAVIFPVAGEIVLGTAAFLRTHPPAAPARGTWASFNRCHFGLCSEDAGFGGIDRNRNREGGKQESKDSTYSNHECSLQKFWEVLGVGEALSARPRGDVHNLLQKKAKARPRGGPCEVIQGRVDLKR